MIYGGLQKVDLTTHDGVTTDSTGTQLGASIEAGILFEPLKRLTVEPSIRLGYNYIKYDAMQDEYGKEVEFDNVSNFEVEAGVKVEKTFFGKNSFAKLYFKPSIIQNIGTGKVSVTSLGTVEGVEDQTLLRGEIGGSFSFGNGWGGFGSVGHTTGEDYSATDFNLGVNYSW
jgi:outer membrane autotransporter protein